MPLPNSGSVTDRLNDALKRRMEQLGDLVAQVELVGDPIRAANDFEYYYQQVFWNIDKLQFPYGPHQHFVVRFITWEGHKGVYPEQKLVVMPPGTGKSNIVSKALASWLVGREPDSPTCLATSTSDLASDRSVFLRELVEGYEPWKTVFPDVQPHPVQWKIDQWSLVRKGLRRRASSEPTFRSTGADASIGGIRIKYGIVDDAHNNKNARTPGEREKIKDWYHTQWAGRFTGMEGWQVMLANIWHGDDLTVNLWESGQWATMHMRALYEDREVFAEVTLPNKLGDAGPALADWCEIDKDRWTWNEKDHKLRMVIHRSGPAIWPSHETAAQLESKKRSMSNARFERVWNGNRKAVKGLLYREETFRYWSLKNPPRFKTAQMVWDTASEETERSDFTAAVLQYIGVEGDLFTADVLREKLESGMALPLAIACWYFLAKLDDIPVSRVMVEQSAYARSSIRQVKKGWPTDLFIQLAQLYLSYDETVPSLVQMIRKLIEQKDRLPEFIKVPLHGIKLTKGGKMEVHEDAVAYYESGNVYHLAEMDKLALLEDELLSIPGGARDDVADAQAHGIVNHFRVRRPRREGETRAGFMFIDVNPMTAAYRQPLDVPTRRGV